MDERRDETLCTSTAATIPARLTPLPTPFPAQITATVTPAAAGASEGGMDKIHRVQDDLADVCACPAEASSACVCSPMCHQLPPRPTTPHHAPSAPPFSCAYVRMHTSSTCVHLPQVTEMMRQNIEAVVDRGEHLELLVDKSEGINSQARQFQQQSVGLRKALWWKNLKNMLLTGGLVFCLVLAVVFYHCGLMLKHCRATNADSHALAQSVLAP